MSSHFALFEIQLCQQVLVKVINYIEVLRWQNCHRSAAPPSICSSTTTFPPSVPTTSCSPYLIRCKTNITTSSFSSCNKCIRNRSKFLLTELFFILIQLKPQLNKLKMMLLIIQKMYWESEFVTTREAEQAVNCDLSNQCTNKLLVLINMIKRRFLHHRYKIHFQTKLVAQFLPTNFFFCSYCDKGFENEDILKDHNSGRVRIKRT